MSNIGYREIMDTSPLSIKQLNDTLRALWAKVMGNIGERDLDEKVVSRIRGAVDTATFETQVAQTAQQISLMASQETVDALTGEVEANTSALNVQADQITAKVSKSDFDDFAETVLTKDAFEVNIDGDTQLHVGADGVSAQSVTAPNVAAAYDGPDEITVNPAYTDEWIEAQEGKAVRSLQQALDRLNGRRVPYDVTISMDNTSHYETVDIHGITGSGMVQILGNGSSFYGGIRATACTARIALMGTGMTIYAGSGRGLEVSACSWFRLDGANVSGSGSDGAYYTEGSSGLLWGCDFAGYTNAITATMGARVLAHNCTGSGAVKGSYGGVVAVNGTMPTGGTTTAGNGQVWADGATGTGGSTQPTTGTITAASYDATKTATCRGTATWNGEYVRQGYYEGLGVCKGCVWFDNSSIRSALSGKSIKSASLRLTRRAGSGRSSAAQVTVRGLTLSGTGGTMSNDTGAAVYGGVSAVLGEIANGETVAFALPVSLISALVSGSINGFALYAGETSAMSGRSFSKNYCRFGAAGEEGAPVLTVNYM